VKISRKEAEQLIKTAEAVTRRLEESTETVRVLTKTAAEQTRLIEAQKYAIELVKEGMIDPDQFDEIVGKALKHGLEIYKEAAGMASSFEEIPFGELSEDLVEKTASGPTYKGMAVNPVEATLLRFREQKYGIPSGLDD
jgi:hypothetical protein